MFLIPLSNSIVSSSSKGYAFSLIIISTYNLLVQVMLSVFQFLLSEHTLFKDSGEKPCSHRNNVSVSLLDSEQEGEFVRPSQGSEMNQSITTKC